MRIFSVFLIFSAKVSACVNNIYDEDGELRDEVADFIEDNGLNAGQNGPY